MGLSESDQKMVEKMNARWRKHRDATEQIEVQNISMMEPLPSRDPRPGPEKRPVGHIHVEGHRKNGPLLESPPQESGVGHRSLGILDQALRLGGKIEWGARHERKT